MDVLKELRKRVESLSPTELTSGLTRVLEHLEAAERHIRKGRRKTNQPFNDAIYRINQAFEGSLREAYQALSGRSPGHLRSHELEAFLKDHVSAPVRAQLATYRKDWRNVSAHDHRAYFTEDEAILASVSVGALALLLVDVVAVKIGAIRAAEVHKRPAIPPSLPLAQALAIALKDLKLLSRDGRNERPLLAEITGAVRAYLLNLFPNVTFETGLALVPDRPVRVDLLASSSSARVIIEVKRQFLNKVQIGQTIERLSSYMQAASLTDGVLYVFRGDARSMSLWKAELNVDGLNIFVAHPVQRLAV